MSKSINSNGTLLTRKLNMFLLISQAMKLNTHMFILQIPRQFVKIGTCLQQVKMTKD